MILLMDTPHITIFPLSFPASPKALALHLPPRARRQAAAGAAAAQIAMLANRPLGPFLFSLHCACRVKQ